MSAPGDPRRWRLEAMWRRFWAECLRGGTAPDREADMKDAFIAGALGGLCRAKLAGRDVAWGEACRLMRTEHLADVAPSLGLRPVGPGGPEPAKGWMAS